MIKTVKGIDNTWLIFRDRALLGVINHLQGANNEALYQVVDKNGNELGISEKYSFAIQLLNRPPINQSEEDLF